MPGELWASLWLILGCAVWLIFLLRAEFRLACASEGSPDAVEGMTPFASAYVEPKEPPMTKSAEPGTLGAFDPSDLYAPADLASAPAPAPAPAPVFSLASTAYASAPVSQLQGLAPFPAFTR